MTCSGAGCFTRRLAQEVEEELAAHLALETQQLAERGVTPGEAEARARQSFGNRTLAAEGAYQSWGYEWLDRLGQDVRYAGRSLRGRPGFTAAAVLSLALGIGATSAVFAIADALFLRPLPYPEPSRLLWIAVHFPGGREFLASPDYVAWRRDNHSFEQMAAAQAMGGEDTLLNADRFGGRAQEVHSIRVSANFLRTFGIAPIAGRDFAPAEELPNGPRAVLLTYRLWQKRFRGDRAIVRHSISLDGQAYSVAGVLPESFQFPMDVPIDVVATLPVSPTASHHDQMMMTWAVYGRVKPGVTVKQARADLGRLFAQSKRDMPPMFRNDTSLVVERLHEHRTGDARRLVLVLLAAVTCLLLITCANVANLLLGRWSARSGEFAVRAALGAGRVRLARQLFTEAAVLSVGGAVLGSAVLVAMLRVFSHYASAELPRQTQLPMDARVFAIALAVSVTTTLLFALLPVLRTGGRGSLQPGLQQFGRGVLASRQQWLKRALVVVEVALSLLLLCGAALLLETLWHLRNDHLGFAPEQATMISIPFKGTALDRANRQPEIDELLDFLHSVPGTEAAAWTECSPLSGGALTQTFSRSDRPMPEGFHRGDGVHVCGTGPEFPAAAGLHIIEGRFLTPADRAQAGRAVVINRAAARAFFPREDPLGKLALYNDGHWRTVIGVISDSKNAGLNVPAEPQAFVNMETWPDTPTVDFIVRTLAEPRAFNAAVTRKLHELDPGLVAKFETLDEQISTATAGPRFNSILLGGFAGLAFLMTSIGIYGVLAFAVTQRTGEIAVRLALGAKPGQVFAMILQEGVGLVLLGVALGSSAFWYLARYLESFLYGVRLSDPLTYAAVLLPIAAVAWLAIAIPARRAAAVDPVKALRQG